jgi:hypothetical protein
MKKNIIDILIKEQLAAANVPKGKAPEAKFNPDPAAVLPGKYIGDRSNQFAWNEATKSYWMKPKKANIYQWRNMFYEPEYKSLSLKLVDAFDEYVKDLDDAQKKAAKAVNNPDLSNDENSKEKKEEMKKWWQFWKRAKETIERQQDKIINKISGKIVYKTDAHFYYKLENGIYSYQEAASTIDPNAWKTDDKVLTSEIVTYLNGLPERTETGIVNIYKNRFDADEAEGAEIKPVPDPNDATGVNGTNYIKLDGIYYSEPFVTKPNGTKTTTALASIIYTSGLQAYNNLIKNIDTLPIGKYINSKSTTSNTSTNSSNSENNTESTTVITQGKWQYKKENDRYYTRAAGKTNWIDIDTSKLSKQQKQTAKANIDKMFTDANSNTPKETQGTVPANDLKTILTNINNTYKLGESFSANAINLYDKLGKEVGDKSRQEYNTIYNNYYNTLNKAFNEKYKPALTKAGNEVEALQTNANESTLKHIGYVLHNIDIIEKQKTGWLNFYSFNKTPEFNGKAEIYKIQDNNKNVIESVTYGTRIQ